MLRHGELSPEECNALTRAIVREVFVIKVIEDAEQTVRDSLDQYDAEGTRKLHAKTREE